MDATPFDRIAKLFAARRTRRQAIVQAGTGLAAAGLAAAGLARSAHAQEATPPTTAAGEKTMFLFLQAFQGGRIAPAAGAEGRYTLTLEQGLGQTVYFSDRPERIVGASPTPAFLAGLGFAEDNPPNAALVVETASGATEIAVVELFDPSYDEATRTATYEVAVLDEWEAALGVGLAETPADLAAFGAEFGAAHLFIDDCADQLLICYTDPCNGVNVGTLGTHGMCWSWDDWTCHPCGIDWSGADAQCNATYSGCEDACVTNWTKACL